ncbi:MAG: hypothetical protein ACREMP_00610 [Candidatus Tyrphobacter sp.]
MAKPSQEHLRTLLWIGAAGLAVGVGFAAVRLVLLSRRPQPDETSRRIQQLIDEANQLLRTLDEQRNSA